MHCKPNRIVILLVALGCWHMGDGLWIYAKARLAQYLIADAWQQTLVTGSNVKPWPWADTWPVARLQVLDGKMDLYVLDGANGSTLAFGPGHMQGSAHPGTDGVSIIGGHRDTHFRFLQQLTAGDVLEITTRSGKTSAYRVVDQYIADSTVAPLRVKSDDSLLLLITCYPFDSLRAGGPLRYVVTAVEEQAFVSTDTVLL